MIKATRNGNPNPNNSSGSWKKIVETKPLTEYIDFLHAILGISLTYEDIIKMTPDQKKAYIRESQLEKLTN